MGGCGTKIEASRNTEIDKEINATKKKLSKEIKLLLLGAGESGKSTIAKQMRILHSNGFSDKERDEYKVVLHNNTIAAMKTLILACQNLQIPLEEANTKLAEQLLYNDRQLGLHITNEIADLISQLWQDKGIKQAYTRGAEFHLADCAGYYFDSVERFSSSGYVPTEQDILHSRSKTCGIYETQFDVDGAHFRLVDVGGQRSERRKWLHCFQDVTAVIFCVALSEYDQKLYEDDATNRMLESLKLFSDICRSGWFGDSPIVLFLNKKDIFETKIQKTNITTCFPDYSGTQDFKAASCYISNRFCALNDNPRKLIYPHITCATDTQNIQYAFNSIRDSLLHKKMLEFGM